MFWVRTPSQLFRAVEHHATSTVDGTRRSLPPRLRLDGLLQSRGADAAVAGDRRCHYVFDAQGGVGLVSSIAVDVVEVRQRKPSALQTSVFEPE